jgi:hypothetical protein
MHCYCQQATKTSPHVKKDKVQLLIIDSTFRDTVKKNIQLISDKYFASFKTPIEVRFFSNGFLTDSIVETDFRMISWYSSRKDTIDLVSHIGEIETVALLVRFISGKPTVLFFRAPHEVGGGSYFKIDKDDSLSHQIEVPPIQYKLELSKIPDTLNKQVVYGRIDMESGDYYDSRDSIEQKHRVQMSFYFQSQYRKFDY